MDTRPQLNKSLIAVFVVVFCVSVVGFAYILLSGLMGQDPQLELKSLLSPREFSLDSNSLVDAQVAGEVQLLTELPDGSFASMKIVDASLQNGKLTKATTAVMPNGEAITFSEESLKSGIKNFVLRDGTTTTAKVIEYPVAFLHLQNGETRPVILTSATIVKGRVERIFAATDIATNFAFAARILNRVIENGYISDTKNSYPAIIPVLLPYLESRVSFVTSANVLAAQDSVDPKEVSVDYDQDTFRIASATNTQQVSLSLIQDLIDQRVVTVVEDELAASSSTNQISTYVLETGAVTGLHILNDTIENQDIKNAAINSEKIEDNSVTSSDIQDGTITNSDLSDNAVNGAKIENNSISVADLSNALVFDNGDFIDLGAINHSTSTPQGLRLPNTSLSAVSPSSGEGYIAWDATNDEILVYDGAGWTSVSSGGGGGSLDLQEGDATAATGITVLDFVSNDFTLSESPSGEGNIGIDYANSEITRANQAQTISSLWTFSSGISINSETVTDFSGVGITVSGGAITSVLGTTVESSEISDGSITDADLSDDTINFDKVASALSLDEATTISAAAAVGLQIGSNVTLSTTESGAIIATDLSCADCIGATEIVDLILGTDTSGNYVATISGGAGLTGSGASEGSTPILAVGAGSGIAVNADDIAVNLATTGTTGSTSSNSGLEVGSGGLSLLKGCADNQILKWSDAEGWACATDDTGGGAAQTPWVADIDADGFDVQDLSNIEFRETTGAPDASLVAVYRDNSGDLNANALTGKSFNILVNGTDEYNFSAVGLSLNSNNLLTGNTTLSPTELDVLDAGIALSELTDSGTLTATTVDINGGAIDGTTIGASSASAATVTTLTANTSVTLGGDTIDEFAGTGLTVVSGDLQAVLGTSIANNELVDDTLDLDKVADSLTLDAQTTIAAGSALNFLIGNNVTFSVTGSGAIIATELNCTDCIGSTEIADLTLGTDTSGNYVATVTGGAGLTGSGATEGSTPTLAVGAGSGITVNADDIAVNLATTGTTGATSSNSGLEVGSGGLSLLKGCADNEVLKWTDAGGWACATDTSGSGAAVIQENDSTVVASLSTLDFLGADFVVTDEGSGEAGVSIDYANSEITRNNISETIVNDWTFDLAEAEDLAINWAVSGTQSGQAGLITVTNSSASGNQYGLYIDNAASSGTTDALLALDNSDSDTAAGAAISIIDGGGGFTNLFNVNGTGISGTEFLRLDGKDAALVDVNDVVTTAITGTGTLTSGASGAGFTLNFGASTLSGNITGANLSNIDVSDDTNLAATSGITLTGDSVSLASSTGGDGLTYTTGVLAVGAGTGITVNANDVAVNQATAFTWTGNQSWTSTVTATGSIQDINLTLGDDSDVDTVSGLNIDTTSASTGDADVVYGINVNNVTSADATVVESAIRVGSGWDNALDLNGTLLSSNELSLLDSGVALSELTDSGTLTAGTVDINGGAIDGTAIGANSRSTAAVTTLNANGNITLGDANTDTITINSGSSGSGITFADSSFANCSALETVSGVLTCGSDAAGSNQTPWTADIDADGYDIQDLSNIEFAETTGAPAGSAVAFFRDNSGDLTANVLTGKSFNLSVNGSDEYNFSSTAFSLNSNNLLTGNTTLSAAELDILDSGIALSELTDSGTLTAGTVDINGGAIDGAAIGANSASSAAFTTLSTTGVTTLGNNSATVAINSNDWDISTTGAITGVAFDANGSGNTITNIENADLADDTIDLDKVADSLALDADLLLTAGAAEDLTVAKTYTDGTGENGVVLSFTAADSGSATNSQFGLYVDNLSSTEGLDASLIIDNSDADDAVAAAIKIVNAGGNFTSILDIEGTLLSGAELTRLDGKDADLVDVNDAVTTAITGTGTLTSGATGAGFTVNFGTSTLSGNVTGANISNVDISDDTNLTATSGVSLVGDQLSATLGTAIEAGELTTQGTATDEFCLTSETGGGALLAWQACGGSGSLDEAYNNGSTITVDAADVLFDLNDATNDYAIVIDNNTAAAIAAGLTFTSGGGGGLTTAIDASATEIGTAIAIGSNDVTVGGATLSSSELALLDSGVALSELTDSGTFTATTVDINGGAIDGAIIGASSAAAGTFTTLTVNTSLTRGSDTITDFTGNGLTLATGAVTALAAPSADALSSTTSTGSGLEVLASGIALLQGCSNDEILKWSEGSDVWACATDSTGGGGSSLQSAYDADANGSNAVILTTADDGAVVIQTIAGTQFQVAATAAPTVDFANITNAGQGVTTTSGVDGLSIVYVQATDATAVTGSGLDVTLTPSGDASDTVRGITLNNVTSGSSTETGLYIGTGYDRDIEFADTTPTVRLADGSVLSITDGTQTLASVKDQGTYAFLNITPKSTTADPASCAVGDVYINSTDATIKACTGTNTWEALDGGSSGGVKVMTLTPEYAGATLTANGSSSINGTMTSDISSSADGWKNYYEWLSSQTSLQDYTVAVRVKLPNDFSSWDTSNAIVVNYVTKTTSNANSKVDVDIRNEDDTPGTTVYTTSANVSSVAETWTSVVIDDSNIDEGAAPDWDAAGEDAVFLVKMYSKDSNYARIGDIVLTYNAQ